MLMVNLVHIRLLMASVALILSGCSRPEEPGRVAVLAAIDATNLTALTNLASQGIDIDENGPPPLRYTPLMWAVESGNLEAVRFLISQAVNLNRVSGHGETALLLSARRGDENLEITRVLLEAGADAAVADSRGITPFEYAFTTGSAPKTVELLENAASSNSADDKRDGG